MIHNKIWLAIQKKKNLLIHDSNLDSTTMLSTHTIVIHLSGILWNILEKSGF